MIDSDYQSDYYASLILYIVLFRYSGCINGILLYNIQISLKWSWTSINRTNNTDIYVPINKVRVY